jgi:acyl-CoA thioester hydrolase
LSDTGSDAQPYETFRRIYISDTDASGLIFFGAVTRWIAEAHTDMMSSFGVVTLSDGAATPTRALSVEYDHPLHLHDVVLQRAWISALGTTSYAVTHEVVHEATGRVAVRATTRHVALNLDDFKPRPVPDLIASAFRELSRTEPHEWLRTHEPSRR